MQRVTINDVAARAGVSKKTVSHVANGLGGVSAATRQRVEAAIAELGYVASPQARAFTAGRSGLALLLHDGSDEAALGPLLTGLQAGLAPQGLALAVHRHCGSATELERFLAAHRPMGVAMVPPLSCDAELVRICAGSGSRIVALACEAGDQVQPGLGLRQAAADATGWLWALGHRRLAFIAGPEHDPRSRASEAGFLDGLAGAGSRSGAEIVAEGDFTAASGEAAARLLLQVRPRPSAILAANDAMAAGALQAVLAAGLQVPCDISIMGLGDTPAAGLLAPPLASMAMPWQELGRLAAARVCDPAVPLPNCPRPTLVPRGSVGPAVD